MDFFEKKEKLTLLLEELINDRSKKEELLTYINELSNDLEFNSKPLFLNIFNEFTSYLDEMSNKELKQRISMIKGFID